MFVADLNYAVFNKVGMEPCIFGISGRHVDGDVEALRAYSTPELLKTEFENVGRDSFSGANNRIVFQRGSALAPIMDKIVSESRSIDDLFEVRSGLQAYEKGKGTPPQTREDVEAHVFDRQKKTDRHSIRYLEGSDVGRFFTSWGGTWLQDGPWLSQPRTLDIFTYLAS